MMRRKGHVEKSVILYFKLFLQFEFCDKIEELLCCDLSVENDDRGSACSQVSAVGVVGSCSGISTNEV